MKLINTALTLSINWYVPDNWYGSNCRLILVPDNNLTGFETEKDAKKLAGKLAKYVTKTYLKKLKKSATAKDAKIEIFENLPTYKYYSLGPSWSCTNIFITVSQLLEKLNIK